MTEDAIFLRMYDILRQRGSKILLKVRGSSDQGGYQNMQFSPDIDLLEVRENGIVVGYELKGYQRRGQGTEPPKVL